MRINDQNYVDEAECVILKLKGLKNKADKPIPLVTTSKIRNLLAMTADIYNQVMNQTTDKLDEEVCGRIDYLRIRFLYEAGRDENVKNLVNEARLIEILKEINGSKKNYITFSRYMEALVAFRKFHGGRDE